MSDFMFARSQMAVSLAFHIIFAVVGIGMPLLMAIAEGVYLRTKKDIYLELSKRWATGTAILFAVGAVSGTVLSFELGLLWPTFMEFAGGIIGMPFSLEGFAFFTEAIFLGIVLYGWDRIPPFTHWLAAIMVAVSGAFSGIFVVTANAWMNTPAGFEMVDGEVVSIDPVAAMLNPAAIQQVVHMIIAAYVATGFVVAAVHAFFLLRGRTSVFHRRAFGIALAMACVSIPLQIVSGDFIARQVAEYQPAKFAAMEGQYDTESCAPITIGGLPDDDAREVRYGLELPCLLSLLAHHDPDGVVTGLEDIPEDLWPNTTVVHWSFDIMVACGMAMLAVALWAGWLWWRHRTLPLDVWFLRAVVAAGPLGFIAIEAGWFVTEVGRQPWIIYGIMKTEDAVTPMPGLVVPFTIFTIVYLILSVILVFLLRRQFVEPQQTTASGRKVEWKSGRTKETERG